MLPMLSMLTLSWKFFDSSRKHGIQFWAFTLCCREWYREDPTLENIRLQCNTNLAYGAQVNQFFVYRCTSGTDYAPLQTWGWADESHQDKIYYGPNDVKYTDAYYVCKDYNREMHNFGFVFKDSYVQKVLNTNVLNGWLECFTNADLPPQMKSITTEDETLFSFVENNGNQYIAVINAAWHGTRTVKVEVNDLVFAIDHDGTFTPLEPGKEYDIALGGGDMVVFKYN